MKRLYILMLCAVAAVASFAQSGTNSPYSQYGLGMLYDQSMGYNSAMGGISQGLRGGGLVNFGNPASYSAIDSLTMIFDAGMSLQVTNFKEGGKKVNAQNSDFDYATGLFRLLPHVGVSFGFIPYSNVGYNYSSKLDSNAETTSMGTHSGDGGVHQFYVGMGWEVMKNLSVGVNASYIWGTYEKMVTITHGASDFNKQVTYYTGDLSSYKLDFGLQYTKQLNPKDALTFGVTYGLGHKMHGSAEYYQQHITTGGTNADTMSVEKPFALPHTFGVGAVYSHRNKWIVGLDYQIQKWADTEAPEIDLKNKEYRKMSGMFSDRHRIAVGAECVPDATSRKHFLNRVHYRFGASYTTPYIKINGMDGPKELSLTAGVGVPILNKWNARSTLNVSAQWVNRSASNLITENSFRINVGLTFNEAWFTKWKVE